MATECWLLQVRGRAKYDYNQCNLHYELDGVTAADQLVNGEALIAGWLANQGTEWLAAMPDDYQLERLVASRVKPALGPESSTVYQDGAQPGTFGDDCHVNGFCPSIRLIPPLNTISAGKIFLPAVPIGAVADNAYIAGYLTAIDDYMNLGMAGYSQSGITIASAIYSRKNDSYVLTTAYTMSPVFGFQRRRQRPL